MLLVGSGEFRAFKGCAGRVYGCRSLVDCCLVLYLVEGEKGLSLFHILPFVDIYLGDESRNKRADIDVGFTFDCGCVAAVEVAGSFLHCEDSDFRCHVGRHLLA